MIHFCNKIRHLSLSPESVNVDFTQSKRLHFVYGYAYATFQGGTGTLSCTFSPRDYAVVGVSFKWRHGFLRPDRGPGPSTREGGD